LPFRFSLRTLLLATAALALFLFGIRLGWLRAVENMRETKIKNGFKEVYLALSNFDGARLRLPSPAFDAPNGRAISSWRFRVLPYWGFPMPRDRYDAPWNAPINREMSVGEAPDFYCVSNDSYPHDTNVFLITGPGTAFERGDYNGHAVHSLTKLPQDVILCAEVSDSKTHWMQPGDYDVTKLLAATGKLGDTVKGLLPDRVHVLFADGEVWALSPDAPMDALKPFLTIGAAKGASREGRLARYRIE